jgi:1-acyl-sn-glycerol-3-phosphate acyltransferase
MKIIRRIIATGLRLGLEILCKIEKRELMKVPGKGPLIIFSNHTGMVEVPILFSELLPRPVIGVAKIESWDNWFLRPLFDLFHIIPIKRGEADMEAMHSMIKVLDEGYLLGMSPEGTRNKTGALLKAYPGVVILALKSNSPLMPVAHWGGENFRINLKQLKRTEFHIRCGKIFYLDTRGKKVTKEIRQQMVDEMMYQLAMLLPPQYRGAYSDLENVTTKFLRFVDEGNFDENYHFLRSNQ